LSFFVGLVDVNLLCHMLLESKRILQSPETHMDNVNFICNILENIWCTIHLENKVSHYFAFSYNYIYKTFSKLLILGSTVCIP